MSADNGIYIGSWNVNGTTVYSVVETSAIDNLDYYKRQDLVKLTTYIKSVWGAGQFFDSQSEAIMQGLKYERERPTEYGVVVLETFPTPAPLSVVDWLNHRQKSNDGRKANENQKFWLVYSMTGKNPTFRHSSLESAQAEAERLAKKYSGTFFVLEAVGKAASSFSQTILT